jgi:ectoine hydroxylase-related dioxygenase (phytanoyl-CoA dioxygenase family)
MNWLEEYRDCGFVVFANLLPADLIDAHVAQVAALLHKFGVTDGHSLASLQPEADDALMVDMLALHRNSATASQLIHQPIVSALLRQLFQAEPVLSMARSALWEPGNMRAHIDTAFRSPEPPYSVCRAWCALEDIDPCAGNFYLVPGTHRSLTPRLCNEVLEEKPEIEALARQAEADPNLWFRLHARGWPLVSAKVPDRIDANYKTSFDLKKGDVIIFNPALAHGTLACEDMTLSRKMMVCEWTTKEAYAREYKPRRIRAAEILPIAPAQPIDIRPYIAARSATR